MNTKILWAGLAAVTVLAGSALAPVVPVQAAEKQISTRREYCEPLPIDTAKLTPLYEEMLDNYVRVYKTTLTYSVLANMYKDINAMQNVRVMLNRIDDPMKYGYYFRLNNLKYPLITLPTKDNQGPETLSLDGHAGESADPKPYRDLMKSANITEGNLIMAVTAVDQNWFVGSFAGDNIDYMKDYQLRKTALIFHRALLNDLLDSLKACKTAGATKFDDYEDASIDSLISYAEYLLNNTSDDAGNEQLAKASDSSALSSLSS
ncbi:MAG: hypothetical protein Q3962_06835 [Corynebacterium sp.]|nr:hypothetical protein [Corynebacterium sp.]